MGIVSFTPQELIDAYMRQKEESKMRVVSFTPEERDRLRVAYDTAITEGKEIFFFRCDEYAVNYTKYLLEDLDKRFENLK